MRKFSSKRRVIHSAGQMFDHEARLRPYQILATAFEGLTLVVRHHKINEALAEELRGQIHALQLTTLTPDEAAKRM